MDFKRNLLVLMGVATGLVLAGIIKLVVTGDAVDNPERHVAAPIQPSPEAPATATAPSPTPIDPNVIREQAWTKVVQALDEVDEASEVQLHKSLSNLNGFFAERKKGALPFAKAVVSWSGKGAYIKSNIPIIGSGDELSRFINSKFEEHLFSDNDFKLAIEASVKSWCSTVHGLENRMLVNIRADLGEKELPYASVIPSLVSTEALSAKFEQSILQVSNGATGKVGVALGKDMVSLMAGEVAANLAIRVATAVCTRLGVSAGVLSAGAASAPATFGLAIVAAIVVDLGIDWLLNATGNDPATKIEAMVQKVLDNINNEIVLGVADAHALYSKLCAMSGDDSNSAVRNQCSKSARSIEQSGNLGLRWELERMHHARSKLRREALRRLVYGGEQ